MAALLLLLRRGQPNSVLWPLARLRRHAGSLGQPGRSYDGLWSNVTFEAMGVHPALVQGLAAQDLLRPTLVQAEAFMPIAKGRDVVLRAETGSGKTLAYLLPLVNRIYHLHDKARESAKSDPAAANPLQRSRPWVVLAPTSDLCAQILAMLEAVDADRLVVSQSLQRLFRWEALHMQASGGFREPRLKERTTVEPSAGQAALRRSGAPYTMASPRIRWGAVDLVVTTPAKFCEDLEQFKEDGIFPACMVMDEADMLFHGPNRIHMYDIFGVLRPRLKIRQADEQRERLPELIPTQFIFSSATMLHIGPFSVGNMIIERFCTADNIETPHFHKLPAGITPDHVRWLPGSDDWDRRVDQLVDLLRNTPCDRTLVFVNSLHNCHVLLNFLRENGWPVTSFMKGPMGRMGPRFRDARRFADGESSVMLATEFGGRGIDWHEVDHVVNFQMPTSAVCWLHRVGRTGRIGRPGLVTNFIGTKDQTLSELIRMRLAAGKDLHGVFSRQRSLPKKLRSAKEAERAQGEDSRAAAEDGVHRLDGGLELYQDGLQGGPADRGTLIGYLSVADEGEEAGAAGRRLRQQAREAGGRRGRRGAELEAAEGSKDSLGELQDRLLASDSESDSELEGEGRSEGEDSEGADENPAALADQPFSWSSLDDRKSASVVASPPQRQLLNRGRRRDESPDPKRYQRQEVDGQRRPGGRRGLGPTQASRVQAGRNYAAPDDDLLL